MIVLCAAGTILSTITDTPTLNQNLSKRTDGCSAYLPCWSALLASHDFCDFGMSLSCHVHKRARTKVPRSFPCTNSASKSLSKRLLACQQSQDTSNRVQSQGLPQQKYLPALGGLEHAEQRCPPVQAFQQAAGVQMGTRRRPGGAVIENRAARRRQFKHALPCVWFEAD